MKLIKERGSLFRVNGIPAASLPEKEREMSKFAMSILMRKPLILATDRSKQGR